MIKVIHAMDSRETREVKALEVADQLEAAGLGKAAKIVREGYAETLTYTRFPRVRWQHIRPKNAIGRLTLEIRRHTRFVGTFPDGNSATTLVAARL